MNPSHFFMNNCSIASVFKGFVAIIFIAVWWPAAMAQTPGATRFEGIGRAATPAEVGAWDIDVRADFKGLPKGAGSVAAGERVWEAQCASCHGVFGESNEVFTPIVGGTTRQDMQSGRVAALLPGANTPQRTTMMKLSSLSTLWDYINRAMPWTAPKSLSADEVYAVSAYILHLADVVPAQFTLSRDNMAATQALLPNRNGKITAHALWPGTGAGALSQASAKPDVQGSACQSMCKTAPSLSSFLPDYARNAHGNLAEQSRNMGPQRGADTTVASKMALVNGPLDTAVKLGAAQVTPVAVPAVSAPSPEAKNDASALTMAALAPLLNQYACTACHAPNAKGIGPSFKAIAGRYATKTDAQAYLQGKIKAGGQGVWGAMPMPRQALSPAEAARIATWLVQGASP